MAAVAVFAAEIATLIILGVTAAAGSQSPIAGDPGLYKVIASAILSGEIPYTEYPLEHLPGAVVPMLIVDGLSRLSGVEFETVWPTMMGLAFIVTVGIANTFPTDFDAGRRLLWYSLPLLPLVLFRIEPWLMLWVVASMMFTFRRSWRAQIVATAVASFIKGWPLLLFALPFQLSRKKLAIVSAGATVAALVAIALLPGFQAGRAFEGIHSETLVGSLVLVVRGLDGVDTELIFAAGAAYTDVPSFATLLNALIGLSFLGIAGVYALKASEPTRLMRAIGLGVLGVILASPLFSAQFVFWLVPFIIFIGMRGRLSFLLASILTLVTIIVWDPDTLGWALLVLVRNVLLIGLGVAWAREIIRRETYDSSDHFLEHAA
jgi:hypothetical protein